jgi:hypothetical protein
LAKENKLHTDSIFDYEDQFLRRIPPWHFKAPDKISSAAFQNDKGTDRMSVNWLKYSTIDQTIEGLQGFGVARFSAKFCWEVNQEIEHTPGVENSAHCDIIGNKTESICRRFRDNSSYPVLPNPARLTDQSR